MNTVHYRLADGSRHTVTLHRSGRRAVMHVASRLLATGETGFIIVTADPPKSRPPQPDTSLERLRKQFYS